MDYHQNWKLVESHLKTIQKIQPLNGYIRDGIVNLEKWQVQQIRPLFIGKEAHGKGEWSITDHCMNAKPAEFCRESPRSWPKTAAISYALQNGFLDYSQIHSIRKAARVSESLRNIAFINVGKHGAATTTPPKRLSALYNQNRKLLHDQITLCQPNVIIGWNTLGLFETDRDFLSRFANNKIDTGRAGNVRSWMSNGRLFISTSHPAYFKTPTKQYVNDIVNAVKANIESIDQVFPSWEENYLEPQS